MKAQRDKEDNMSAKLIMSPAWHREFWIILLIILALAAGIIFR